VATRKREITTEVCKRFAKTNNKAVARKLMADYPGLYSSENAAYKSVCDVRGGNGAIRRASKCVADKSAYRPKQPTGHKLECPPSLAEKWEPYILETPNKFLVLSDLHVPYHSTKAITAAVEYGLSVGCKSLLINGDLADWYGISRHQKDPRKPRLSEEIKIIKELLGWLLPQFKGQKVYKAGNHEERWDHFIWNNAPVFADMEYMRMDELLNLKAWKCEWVADQRIVMAGKLPIIHGHELGRSTFSPVNQARGAFMRTLHTLLVGHGHRTSTHTEPDMMGSETTCWSTGCLCDLTPEYARVNKWNWGFCTLDVFKSEEFQLENYRINRDGKVRAS